MPIAKPTSKKAVKASTKAVAKAVRPRPSAPPRQAPNQAGPAPTRAAVRRVVRETKQAQGAIRRLAPTQEGLERQVRKTNRIRRARQPFARGIAPTAQDIASARARLEAPAVRHVAPKFASIEDNAAPIRRARQPVLSRGQFKRVSPFGDYNDYLDYVAEARSVDVGQIVRLAPPLKQSRVRKMVNRADAELGRVIAKLDNEIPVAMDLMSEFRDMPPATRARMAKLIELANSYTGTPYSWGAPFDRSSARTLQGRQTGFDCSGFIDALYRATHGISPGGSTHTQRFAGRQIKVGSDYQPGDLIFWHEDRGHVGLYIGDGWFIHAPQTGDVVRITNLSDRETPVQVNRIVG